MPVKMHLTINFLTSFVISTGFEVSSCLETVQRDERMLIASRRNIGLKVGLYGRGRGLAHLRGDEVSGLFPLATSLPLQYC